MFRHTVWLFFSQVFLQLRFEVPIAQGIMQRGMQQRTTSSMLNIPIKASWCQVQVFAPKLQEDFAKNLQSISKRAHSRESKASG